MLDQFAHDVSVARMARGIIPWNGGGAPVFSVAIAVAFVLWPAAKVHAQPATCIVNGLDGFNVEFPYGSGGNGSSIGQTFTACATGFVESVTIHEGAQSFGGVYDFWIAPEQGGPNVIYTAGAPYETFVGTAGGFPKTTTFYLTEPFFVFAGGEYRFVFNSPGIIDIRCTFSAPQGDYLLGEATDDFGTYAPFDLDFEVGIDANEGALVLRGFGCFLNLPGLGLFLFSEAGNNHFVQTPNGNEQLTCRFFIEDPSLRPSEAIVLTDLNCFLLDAVVTDARAVISPNGNVTFTCLFRVNSP